MLYDSRWLHASTGVLATSANSGGASSSSATSAPALGYHDEKNKIAALSVFGLCLWNAICGGTLYMFAGLETDLMTLLHWKAADVDVLYSAGQIGVGLGFLSGAIFHQFGVFYSSVYSFCCVGFGSIFFYMHLPPVPAAGTTLTRGLVADDALGSDTQTFARNNFLLQQARKEPLRQPSVSSTLMAFFYFLIQHGSVTLYQNGLYTGVLLTKRVGRTTGVLAAGYGLSAAVWNSVYTHILHNSVHSFIYWTGVIWAFTAIMGAVFLQVVPISTVVTTNTEEEEDDHTRAAVITTASSSTATFPAAARARTQLEEEREQLQLSEHRNANSAQVFAHKYDHSSSSAARKKTSNVLQPATATIFGARNHVKMLGATRNPNDYILHEDEVVDDEDYNWGPPAEDLHDHEHDAPQVRIADRTGIVPSAGIIGASASIASSATPSGVLTWRDILYREPKFHFVVIQFILTQCVGSGLFMANLKLITGAYGYAPSVRDAVVTHVSFCNAGGRLFAGFCIDYFILRPVVLVSGGSGPPAAERRGPTNSAAPVGGNDLKDPGRIARLMLLAGAGMAAACVFGLMTASPTATASSSAPSSFWLLLVGLCYGANWATLPAFMVSNFGKENMVFGFAFPVFFMSVAVKFMARLTGHAYDEAHAEQDPSAEFCHPVEQCFQRPAQVAFALCCASVLLGCLQAYREQVRSR
ncbi:unnamed protein product [Amoebophrya sp. A120]|nr:unnamed protein product [Amoebophrya sp. A120]|eukprot:GSA120T00006656001.1